MYVYLGLRANQGWDFVSALTLWLEISVIGVQVGVGVVQLFLLTW